METNLAIAMGRIAALERAVASIIATHPAPEKLAEFWRDVVPGWREDLKSSYGDQPVFLTAAEKGLDRFEQTVAKTAQASRPPGNPTDH